MTLSSGQTQTINFDLEAGFKLSGEILDDTVEAGGQPVTGVRVRVNLGTGGPAQRLRTNKKGKYRIWLKSGTYTVQSYGQTSNNLVMTEGNQKYNLRNPVNTIATNVTYNGTGVSQAKVYLLDSVGKTVSQEISNSDGSVKLYCKKLCNATSNKVAVRIDGSRAWASTFYGGTGVGVNNFTSAPAVDSTKTSLPTDIKLLDAGTLKVSITSDGTVVKNTKTRILTDTGSNIVIRTQRTHGDGTYQLSLPADATGTMYKVEMRDDENVECTVTLTKGATTNLTYNETDNVCTIL
ncbi:carboxypeptidase regulatory-like domain-containing protein [Beggiatoa alba]|nr:carboxypeptidase regulatory-like domain-containing protein [Beggiatoa alba]